MGWVEKNVANLKGNIPKWHHSQVRKFPNSPRWGLPNRYEKVSGTIFIAFLETKLWSGFCFQSRRIAVPRYCHHFVSLVPEINPTFPGMTTFQPKISACARVRSLEKKFRAAKPNLIMAKKGMFDWANLEPDQKINHFRYIRNMFLKQRTGVSK